MKNKPLVSVIIPSYNSGKFLAEALDSVLKQEYLNIEIIIVDDGSTDNTREICQDYQNRYEQVKYIYQKNRGLGGARNTGINNASGELFANLDADDMALPNFISKMVKILSESSSDTAAVSPNAQFYQNDKPLDQTFYKAHYTPARLSLEDELIGNRIPSTALIKTAVAKKIGLYHETRHQEDYDFWLRFLKEGCKIALVPKPLFLHRLHDSNLSTNYKGIALAEISLFKRVKTQNFPYSAQLLIKKRLADAYGGLANDYLLKDKLKPAKKYYFKALRSNKSRKTVTMYRLTQIAPWLLKFMIKSKRAASINPKERRRAWSQ